MAFLSTIATIANPKLVTFLRLTRTLLSSTALRRTAGSASLIKEFCTAWPSCRPCGRRLSMLTTLLLSLQPRTAGATILLVAVAPPKRWIGGIHYRPGLSKPRKDEQTVIAR